MSGPVGTRPVRLPEDADFLECVYRSTREVELGLFGWPETEARAFVASQFESQSRHYASYYPDAEHVVILVDGQPGGRMIIDRREDSLHIVDIALLPAFRGRGVGTELVTKLLDEAAQSAVLVTCHVEVGNPARSFWQHLGFAEKGAVGAHIALERPCEISQN